jgi:hypothetical protein
VLLPQVLYSLHDAQFGAPLSGGAVDVDAPLLSLEPAACGVVGAAGEGTLLLRLGPAVHALGLQARPVSLLALVARLAVGAPQPAAAAADLAAGAGKPGARPAAGGRALCAGLAAPPAPVELAASLLAAAATRVAAVDEAEADEASPADLPLARVPPGAVAVAEDLCQSFAAQLAAAAAQPGPPPLALLDSAASYLAGRRNHGLPLPPALLSLAARGLAAAGQWSKLAGLLVGAPQGCLAGCSGLLPAAARAEQYRLLPRLVTCLDDVEARPLVDALAALLAPTTRANLAARQRHHAALRAHAEAAVARAEAALGAASGAAAQAPPRAARGARGAAAAATAAAAAAAVGDPAPLLLEARCAAAAVDGWSYREAALHPLLALSLDAPAVQAELRRLAPAAADALLACVAKWAAAYTSGPLAADGVAGVVLPEELLFPQFHQVTRAAVTRAAGLSVVSLVGALWVGWPMRQGAVAEPVMAYHFHSLSERRPTRAAARTTRTC